MSQEFSAWLKRQIEERGLSVRAASLYAGLSPTTVHLLFAHPERTPISGAKIPLTALQQRG